MEGSRKWKGCEIEEGSNIWASVMKEEEEVERLRKEEEERRWDKCERAVKRTEEKRVTEKVEEYRNKS